MGRKTLNLDLPGNLVPPLTPFLADLQVDWEGLRQQVEYILTAARPAGVLVAAVEAQEYQYLTMEQRRELVRQTISFVDGRAPAIVGISHPSVRQAVALAHLAEELGAAAVQVLIPLRPSGGKAGIGELLAYFEAIARETSLPLVAYHNPGPGAELGPRELSEIGRITAVQAFKESSRNLRHIGQMIESVERPGDAHYFTTMEVLLPSLLLGASGGTMPAPGATIAARVVAAFRAGRLDEAAAHQQAFSLFPSQWMGAGGLVAVMKAALDLVGVPAGDPYPPFAALSAQQRQELRTYLAARTDLLPA